MEQHFNTFGQLIGFPLPGWTERPRPPRTSISGRYCTVEALDLDRHATQLYTAHSDERDGRNWTYLGFGPFASFDEYLHTLETHCLGDDPFFHAIVDHATGEAVGGAAYMRIEPKVGVIEVGGINYSPRLQRRPAATEAMYLMMRRVFDELGYRRYEWKCDSLNAPSRAAALRLGFQYEGLFRQATVYKGRNRDTAWFSILDRDWPALRAAFEAWLDPTNFDAQGRQRRSLASFRSAA
jgi:RimJ/RimL family protein N-acetyltransferase